MINRVLIRLKVLQILYAYYQNRVYDLDFDEKTKALLIKELEQSLPRNLGGEAKAKLLTEELKNKKYKEHLLQKAEQELVFSLSKAYDLYNFLLLLMVEVTKYADNRLDLARNKYLPTKEELNPNLKFVNNRFVNQLTENKELKKYIDTQKRSWVNDQDFVKELYNTIVQSDIYKSYMNSKENSYEEDREVWRKLYKEFICYNESLDELLEDQSLYWNDDKEIVDTFVIKTIKRFKENKGEDQSLLPQYNDVDDEQFARELLREAILDDDYYQKLITENTKNWDFDRIALMDVIIMQCALAEILKFPNIPVSVSLNEYVEISKGYSTTKSSSFINGALDGIVKQLMRENKIHKEIKEK